MRSRHDKRRRSRISPIDRLIQTQAGSAIVAVVKSTVVKPTAVNRSFNSPSDSPSEAKPLRSHKSKPQKLVIQTSRSKKNATLTATSDDSLRSDVLSDETFDHPELPPKRKSWLKRIIHRLQYPVGWRPVMILILTWVLMLGVIWGAFKEIMSLGASPTKQTIAQIERKTLMELFGALCLGGVGLSLALTPALKRPPRHNPEPLQARLDSDE